MANPRHSVVKQSADHLPKEIASPAEKAGSQYRYLFFSGDSI
jgi:hypothetical protein